MSAGRNRSTQHRVLSSSVVVDAAIDQVENSPTGTLTMRSLGDTLGGGRA